ncbi:UNVERIFIED_CONTAM: hypothetical protein FKN15_072410 [Acipenser sinensis]
MRGSKWPKGAATVGGPPPNAEGGSVHTPATSWRDRDLVKGDPGALDGASGAQAGDQLAAAPGRGASPGYSAAMSGQPGGAEQETRRPPVPGGAATWESGPVTKGPAEGSNPQAPGCGTGVVVGAVVEVVSSPPSSWPAASLCEAPATVLPAAIQDWQRPQEKQDPREAMAAADPRESTAAADPWEVNSGGEPLAMKAAAGAPLLPRTLQPVAPKAMQSSRQPQAMQSSRQPQAMWSSRQPWAWPTVQEPPARVAAARVPLPCWQQEVEPAPALLVAEAGTAARLPLVAEAGTAARLPLVVEAGTAARLPLVALPPPPTARLELMVLPTLLTMGLGLVALPAPPTAGLGLVAGVSAGLPSAEKTAAAVEPELHALIPPQKNRGLGFQLLPSGHRMHWLLPSGHRTHWLLPSRHRTHWLLLLILGGADGHCVPICPTARAQLCREPF